MHINMHISAFRGLDPWATRRGIFAIIHDIGKIHAPEIRGAILDGDGRSDNIHDTKLVKNPLLLVPEPPLNFQSRLQ